MGIRDYVINNFKDDDYKSIKETINESILENNEETLPGMGVLFELFWKNSSEEEKEIASKSIIKGLKNTI